MATTPENLPDPDWEKLTDQEKDAAELAEEQARVSRKGFPSEDREYFSQVLGSTSHDPDETPTY